ncbi:hypothetical protein N7468_001676 [Penicillium chermesinum]|uniref:Uncharacterized protein n=1 Tax=Penicillium chermesinum TaxID=63820 RepID=A0A9W9PH21_9EURO|nr:uncharacterized protein N7468_001676 [Penicillium chermesinum]KAJ5246693.1 hypothetical protein N7468_001676 [Penicillium chermesinum]
MARRYEIDELLFLRSSPLVAKPAGLPPIEEWMPQPDPTTQRKQSNARDPNNPSETTTHRRPSLFEARHIPRGSTSEDIILGPPKTAFASSRIGGKGSSDLTDRPPRPGDSDEKNERFNFKDRFFRDKDTPERDLERRDGKPPLNNRRGDREDWTAGRPRRTFGPEEQERKPRRTAEFDRWDTRDGPRDSNSERGVREKENRFAAKKDGPPGRSKFEGSWFRDENSHDAADAGDDDKPPLRTREWRREKQGNDREWSRGAKFDQEPEWLDSHERDEPRRAHTQEDFERWKERMKAGAGSSQQTTTHEEKNEVPVEPQIAPPKPETRRTDGEIFSQGATPFMSDTSMERFFGILGDTKSQASHEVSTPTSADSNSKREAPGSKLGKSSRFAGLFSPPPDSPTRAPPPELLPMPKPPPGLAPVSSQDADQEGFQRILKMLGGGAGGRSSNATPNQVDSYRQSRPPSIQEQPRVATNVSSPGIQRQEYASPGHESPQGHEREHLLRLMQQARITPAGTPQQAAGVGSVPAPPPGLVPEMMTRPPPGLGAQKTPNFLDDPAIANMQRPDSDQLRRRPPQQGNVPSPMGPPPGIHSATRGLGAPNFPPGMMPMPGNAPPMNDRQAFPRGPPPGMMLPPGYMGGPPPPGFPPMGPPNPEMLGLGQGPLGPGNPGPQGPPPSSRHLLEMFGQSSGGDIRGGMVPPGQFR